MIYFYKRINKRKIMKIPKLPFQSSIAEIAFWHQDNITGCGAPEYSL